MDVILTILRPDHQAKNANDKKQVQITTSFFLFNSLIPLVILEASHQSSDKIDQKFDQRHQNDQRDEIN